MSRPEEIRIIAYALWVQDGCNHYDAIKHWLNAEVIWKQNRQDTKINTENGNVLTQLPQL